MEDIVSSLIKKTSGATASFSEKAKELKDNLNEKVLSTLKSRNEVGSVKKGVDLLRIVQKLSDRREKSRK